MAVQYANHKVVRGKVYKVLASKPMGMRLDDFISNVKLEGIVSKEDREQVDDILNCLTKHNFVKSYYREGKCYIKAEVSFLIKYPGNGNNGNNGNGLNNYKKSFKKPQNSLYNINQNNKLNNTYKNAI